MPPPDCLPPVPHPEPVTPPAGSPRRAAGRPEERAPDARTAQDRPAPADSRRARRASGRRRGRLGAVVTVGALVVAAGAAMAADAGGGGGHGTRRPAAGAVPAADGLPHTAVEVSTGACGRGWTRPHPGTQAFDLHNSGVAASDVYLADPATGMLYAELEGLAPGRTRSVTVDLGSGRYAFRCLQEDAEAVAGPTVTVPGTLPRGPAALPVTQHDLIPPTLVYQRWIGDRMSELAHGTDVLKADIDRGDLTAARRDWLTAHLVYERMGAAYGTFGEADGVINGVAPAGPGGERAASFTGFHRVEYGLWHGEPAGSLAGAATGLDDAVRELRASWAQARMDPAALGLRAHEILENTAQSELTGRTDYGSGTSLATARANLDGTREILALLRPLLAERDHELPRLDAALDRLHSALDAQRHNGAWTPLADLPRAARERVDAATEAALEDLAPVAAIFDVRRTA